MQSVSETISSSAKKFILVLLSISMVFVVPAIKAHATDAQEVMNFETSTTSIGSMDTSVFAIANSGPIAGFGHVDWAPFNGSGTNASGVDWSTAGQPWAHNFIIRDDGSGTNEALWVQKPESAATWAGVTIESRNDSKSIVSSGHLTVSARVKAADANVPVKLNLFNDGNSITISQVATTGAANTWSTLIFDFTTPSTGSFDAGVTYSQMAFNFDPTNAIAGNGHDNWGYDSAISAAVSKLYLLDDVTYTPVIVAGGGGGGGLPSIRLVPQPITSGGSANANDYTSDISAYYSAGSKSYQGYMLNSDTKTLVYQVTTDGTTPAPAGQTVKLFANSPYSGSNANWSVNSTTVAPHSAFDGGYGALVTALTDADGKVTFTISNTDSTGFETAPTSPTQSRPGSGRLYGTFKPVLFVGGNATLDTAEDTDLISFDVYSSGGSGGGGDPGTGATHANPDKATLTLATWGSSGLKGSGPVDDSVRGVEWFLGQYYTAQNHWFYSYADAGATLHLTWHVTDSAGNPLTSTVVKLKPNFGPGNPNATWTSEGISDGVITKTTDGSGNVTFDLINTNENPSGDAPADITSNDTALGYENSHTYPWSRMTLVVSTDTISADPNTTVNQVTDLLDVIVIPAGSLEAVEGERAAAAAARIADKQARDVKAVKVSSGDRANIVADVSAKTITCSAPSVTGTPTMAAYYLYINHKLVAGQRVGSFYVSPLHPEVDAAVGSATVTSASWPIAPSWNNGHISTASCDVQLGNEYGTTSSKSAATTIARVGKYVASSKKATTVTDVTMRLVSPTMTKDASGKSVDFVDESSSPIQDHWSQYYGNANGGLGVFYKYFTVGSTLNIKYHVTDSKSGAALAYFNVWLVVNKNYGGVENATFSYQRNGITYAVAPHATDLGETQIPGITDINGDVSFTLVNTNSAITAEPTPAALNKVQPTSVTPVFSTITLMAHLNSGSETKETKDFIWAHIVKP